MEPILGQRAAPAAAGPLVKDSTARTFVADVIEASREAAVLVDFWAPWCGPCRQLTPLLEKIVAEGKGAVRLVKVNIDENPDIARQFRIQSIPAVFAFRNGQPVDGFMGALPESQVRQFVKRLVEMGGGSLTAEIDALLAAGAEALAHGDYANAAQAFAEVLQQDPQKPEALAGLARCYLETGDRARASQTIAAVPEDKRHIAEVASVLATLALAEKAGDPGSVGALRARLAEAPGDHAARFDLAMALIGAGDAEGAIDELLEIVRRDRNWEDARARKELVTLFEALGPGDPLVASGRRRLSSLLFA